MLERPPLQLHPDPTVDLGQEPSPPNGGCLDLFRPPARIETQIRRRNADLEERVRVRTEQLQERIAEVEMLNRGMVNLLEDLQEARVTAESTAGKLEQANRQLDLANRELEAFSYSVSHDLRAPLRNVAGFVDLLSRTLAEPSEQTERYLKVIAGETRRMEALIDDLLSFSRLGRAELRQQRVDMDRLCSRAWDALAADRDGRDIQWKRDPLHPVRGDPSLLMLVWINLISNALKYTRPRVTARIHTGQVQRKSEQGEPTYFVKDNGVGFDMRYAHKLFGVFQRLHQAREFEGTGIGLANVQRILQRHGGRIWAEAAVNEGACFYFSFPRGE
jgi:light-regulated signal transduction histidine kinase (bacteriophytochrome)